MVVYMIIREGVYMQGVVGIFTEENVARQKIQEAIAAEKDDYHDMNLYAVEVDCFSEKDKQKHLAKLTRKKGQITTENISNGELSLSLYKI